MSAGDGASILIPAYYVSAGIALHAAMLAFAAGVFRRSMRVYLTFSAVCLSAAGYLYSTAQYYTAASVPEAAAILQVQYTFVFLFFPAFYLYVALYSGQKRIAGWGTLVTVVFLVLMAVNLASPFSLRFSSLRAEEPLMLPWGETIARFSGAVGPWNWVAPILALPVYLWSIWRGMALFRAGRRRPGVFLILYCLLQLATTVQGKLVDLGFVTWPYMAGFAFLILVLLMCASMGLDLYENNVALKTTTTRLLEEVDRRREAEEKIRREIVERQALSDMVRRVADEWHHTFDAIDSTLLLLDTEGRVRQANRAACELSGLSEQDIIGEPVASIGTGEPWQGADRIVRIVCASQSGASMQLGDASSGKTWNLAANIFFGEEFEDRVIVVAYDVTEMVALQESLRHNEVMSAMGALVAGVAHEVRNPLFGISATLDAFEARFGQREEYARHLGVLRGEITRLNALMVELLEYGKPLDFSLADGRIEEVIDEAIRACAPRAEATGVRIESRVEGAFEPVAMDRGRLPRVLLNLVENAIQHSPAGQTVTVAAREASFDGRRWIECAVADSGPGFRTEDLPRIFEPFFTKRRGGTGLGLSIAQRIVEGHGGRIQAENREGGGAVMTVRLPRS